MLTLLAFVAALALLIAVHEWGHYRMALACGVKVLRFSIGFGPVLLRWQGRSGTEFTLCLLPLGGYVRMLDEREAEVPANVSVEVHLPAPVLRRINQTKTLASNFNQSLNQSWSTLQSRRSR